jgi:hypothetical protein
MKIKDTETRITLQKEGYDAHEKGATLEDCPYEGDIEIGGSEAYWWAVGWWRYEYRKQDNIIKAMEPPRPG